MSVYWELFKVVFQQNLQYRVAAVAGAFTNIAFGFFRLFLLTAFYSAAGAAQPMQLSALYSYLWFGQVLFGVLPITGMIGGDAEEIRSGAVAYRLTRPISLFGLYYARVLGQKVSVLFTRSAIQVAVLFICLPLLGLSRYGMRAPDVVFLPWLLLSLVLAVALSAALQTFTYMTGFWTISTRGSATLAYALVGLFSGLLVPLSFFPPAFRAVAYALPFRGVYDTPAMIYNGAFTVAQLLAGLGMQVVWLGMLILAAAGLARAGAARIEIAGG